MITHNKKIKGLISNMSPFVCFVSKKRYYIFRICLTNGRTALLRTFSFN